MRINPMTAVLLVLSVVVAGLLGQFRDSAIEDFQKTATLGEALELDNQQTITPLEISFGQFAVEGGGRRSVLSPERLVAVRFEFSTPFEDELDGVRCFLRMAGGSIGEALDDGNLRFPHPGFRSTGTVVFEVTRQNLLGARIACVPTGVIVYREPELLMSLGVDAGNVDTIWAQSSYRRVRWVEPTLEVIR